MFRIFSVLAVAVFASVANAGVMATSQLDITGFRIILNSGSLNNLAFTQNSILTTQIGGGPFVFNGFNTVAAGPQVASLGGSSVSAETTAGGSGSALVAPGIDISSIASGDMVDGSPTTGSSSASAGLSATFGISSTTNITIEFTGLASITEVLSGAGGSSSGFTDFQINLAGAGFNIPAGNLLASLDNSTSVLDLTSVGTSGPTFFTQTLNLTPGAYTFGVSQSSGVTFANVPEPASAIGFCGLAIFGAWSGRRRRAATLKSL